MNISPILLPGNSIKGPIIQILELGNTDVFYMALIDPGVHYTLHKLNTEHFPRAGSEKNHYFFRVLVGMVE